MNMNEVYPSKYIKAADLREKEVSVTIDRVEMGEMGDGTMKPVVYFQGHTKGMVCNKTNSNAISSAYGFESNDWTGKQLILFQQWVEFQGKSDWAIRVKPPIPDKTESPTTKTISMEDSIVDDEIPF